MVANLGPACGLGQLLVSAQAGDELIESSPAQKEDLGCWGLRDWT